MTKILLILVSNLPKSGQDTKAKLALSYYEKQMKTTSETDSMEIDSHADVKHKFYADLLIVFALLSGLHADVTIPDICGLLEWLKVAVESCEVTKIAEYGYQTFASIINKMDEGK